MVDGQPVAMAPERVAHAKAKAEVWLALKQAIERASLPCEAIVDGPSVRIDERTVYEPDALVRCGEGIDERVEVTDPVVVVEVLSPTTRGRDAGAKLEDYFRLPCVIHYLLVRLDSQSIIHHRRTEREVIETTFVRSGRLLLDPPGLEVPVDAVFATLR